MSRQGWSDLTIGLGEDCVPQLAAGARTLVTPVAISLSFDTCQNEKCKKEVIFGLQNCQSYPKKKIHKICQISICANG